MDSIKDERQLLRFTYLLCFVCFGNLYMLKQPHDNGALILALIVCILIAYSHFIIRRFFPDGDKHILIFAYMLSVIGIVMLYRLKPIFGIKQLIWMTVGIIGFILIVVILPDLKKFVKYKYYFMGILLVLMSLGSFGSDINGSKNWITIAGYSFQPSEFGKLFFVAYLAAALNEYKNFKQLIEPAAVVMISLGFLVYQKDLGSALIFFAIAITMLYISTSKLKYTIVCLLLFIAGSVISYKLFPHVQLRIMIWRNLWKYPTSKGYQVVQSLFSIASGGLFGSGLGLGHPEFVPINTSDFIFSGICEEMGILTGFGILIIHFLLFYRNMRAAVYGKSEFSRLVAVGFSTMIASQALVIVGGVINAIPLTGITLPLVSYGGSSMMVVYFALGFIQKISEEGNSYE